MRVVVTGGTGFIGSALCRRLSERGHEVVVPSRSLETVARRCPAGTIALAWDGQDPAPLARVVGDEPWAVINLAGESISSGRWNKTRKERILQSRINATSAVVEAARLASKPPAALVQGSAVGFYGASASESGRVLNESSKEGPGFLARVVYKWERAALPIEDIGVRLAIGRTGLVIGPGGVLGKLLPPFKAFAGGPLGHGGQWLPWIALEDEVQALVWLLENSNAVGIYNLTAPVSVTMDMFCRTLGQVLARPSWLSVPSVALRIALGEMALETVLASQRVAPKRLLEEGFGFSCVDVKDAIFAAIAGCGELSGGSENGKGEAA